MLAPIRIPTDIESAVATFKFDDILDSDERRDLAILLRRIAIDQELKAGLLKFRRPRRAGETIQ